MIETTAGREPLVWRAITDPAALWRLKPDWDALWSRADGDHVLTERACFHAWANDDDPSRRRLHAVTGWEGRRLVFLWPLVIRRRYGLWNNVTQLGPHAGELAAVLTEPGPDSAARTVAAWDFMRRTSRADIAWLDYVKLGSPLHQVLAADPALAAGSHPDVAPYVRWTGAMHWDEYYASLSSYTRKMQNKKHKSLAKTGDVAFEAVSDPARKSVLAGWLLEQKRHWARKTGKHGPWLTAEAYDRFLRDLAGDAAATECTVFTLSANGEVIAALFTSVAPRHVDWIIAAFDPAWGQHSPGLLLNEYALRWAFERGLSVEFGRGNENNKKFWSRGACHDILSYRVAISRRGAIIEAMRRGLAHARSRRLSLLDPGVIALPVASGGNPSRAMP